MPRYGFAKAPVEVLAATEAEARKHVAASSRAALPCGSWRV